MKTTATIMVVLISMVFAGCSTTGNFKIPVDSALYIYKRPIPVVLSDDGKVTVKPFFWTAAGGIPYRLEKDGKIIKEGRLKSRFRVVSIFWPPYALIYWPIGFDPQTTYDLMDSMQEEK